MHTRKQAIRAKQATWYSRRPYPVAKPRCLSTHPSPVRGPSLLVVDCPRPCEMVCPADAVVFPDSAPPPAQRATMVAELLGANAGYLFCLCFSREVMIGGEGSGVGLTEAAVVLRPVFFRNDEKQTVSFCFGKTKFGPACLLHFVFCTWNVFSMRFWKGQAAACSRCPAYRCLHASAPSRPAHMGSFDLGAREQSAWLASCLPTPLVCMYGYASCSSTHT